MIEHHSYMNGKENNLKSMSASRPEGLRRTTRNPGLFIIILLWNGGVVQTKLGGKQCSYVRISWLYILNFKSILQQQKQTRYSDNMYIYNICREGVMEFLLMNHPLDCPICDQGGECPR
jgi:hypothetical protein